MSIFVNGTRVKGAVKRNGAILDKVKVNGVDVYERFTTINFTPTSIVGSIGYSDGQNGAYSGGTASGDRLLFKSSMQLSLVSIGGDYVNLYVIGDYPVDAVKRFLLLTQYGAGGWIDTFNVSQRSAYFQSIFNGKTISKWQWLKGTNGCHFYGSLVSNVASQIQLFCA